MPEPEPIRSAVDHFVMRLLTDCLNEATRAFWLRRANDFLDARPRIGDYHGNKTRSQLRATWYELTEIANACLARAKVAPLDELDPDAVTVWTETDADDLGVVA